MNISTSSPQVTPLAIAGLAAFFFISPSQASLTDVDVTSPVVLSEMAQAVTAVAEDAPDVMLFAENIMSDGGRYESTPGMSFQNNYKRLKYRPDRYKPEKKAKNPHPGKQPKQPKVPKATKEKKQKKSKKGSHGGH